MARQNGDFGTQVDSGGGFPRHPAVLAVSAFALGIFTGLFLKSAAEQVRQRAGRREWHREYEEGVTYDENLPDSLGRREPPPRPGQPRPGGTGALGVHPEAVGRASGKEPTAAPEKG